MVNTYSANKKTLFDGDMNRGGLENLHHNNMPARTIFAASLETSVPVIPIATPQSAAFRAGASFTPSPVIATMCLPPLGSAARSENLLCVGEVMRGRVGGLHGLHNSRGDGPHAHSFVTLYYALIRLALHTVQQRLR